MVIEKVHGLQATSMSLNDRFTLLASMEPVRAAPRPRRRSVGSLVNHNNRALIEQIARHLERESKRLTMRQRLGGPSNLRRFGSESSLPGLFRSNSFSNLSQQSIKNRVAWRQSNNNLRAGALNGMAGAWRSRGVRRRGAARGQRLRMRGARLINGRVSRVQRAQRGAARPGMRPNGARPQTARRGTAFRGRGRGGITRNQQPKVVPSKEELDAQLDQYMAGTKAALDRELDTYMKNAMELE